MRHVPIGSSVGRYIKRLIVDRIEGGLAREKSENLGSGMNRRFWQDSGALGHGDEIRTPFVKNFIDDSVHGSIPVLSDFAIRKKVVAFTKKSSYRMTAAENGILSMFGHTHLKFPF